MCVCVCLYTRHGFEQFGITHLSLPDVSQCVLHPLGPPQEIKHPQVVAHTLSCKHLKHTYLYMIKYMDTEHTHTSTYMQLFCRDRITQSVGKCIFKCMCV